jgi:NAD(P)-dependent dehydrogenase (short-subunit alcohol dehydrogenase family)
MAALQQKVLFIVGGGPRIGHAVAKKFLEQGYKVAIGRRQTEKVELEGALPVYVDVTC